MPYLTIDNFAAGLDTRKSALTSAPGTLQRLTNATVTPGGEIAKRRAFVQVADLTGTFGLAATESAVYAFTRNTVLAPPSFPIAGTSLVFQSIPYTPTTFAQTDFDTFNGKVYLAGQDSAQPAGSRIKHFYNGAATEGNEKGPYIRTYRTKMYGVQGNNLYFSAVGDPTLWNADPIVNVVSLSNANPCVVTVAAADIAKFVNGQLVTISGASATGMTPANGRHTISSAGSPANTFKLTGVDTSAASAPQTTGVTAVPASTARAGAGFINLSNQDSGGELLTSLEVYYDKLAVFSSVTTQLWAVDPDPLQNVLDQVLRSSGTIAPLSTQQYGSGDVLYLATSGIRSLRARDSSNAAAVSDIGSPIDGLIQDLYTTKGQSYFSLAKALLEPIVGRFWMVFPNEIYALSAFPGPKITAWSYYTVPFTVDQAVTCGGRVYLRGTDNQLYVYGGVDGKTYDNCGVEVRLPYLDMGKPGTNKIFSGIDATVAGTWTVKNSFDYNNPDAEETLGVFSAPTWRGGKAAFEGQSTHFSLRFYNNDANPALISNAAVHYGAADDRGN